MSSTNSDVSKKQKLPTWLWWSLGGLAAFALIFLAVSWWFRVPAHQRSQAPGSTSQPPAAVVPAPLTGLPVSPDVVARRPWAVMVENLPNIRPQSGLAAADVVIEAPTESGITRFLAIFQSQLPLADIGPIRSARPYFNEWAAGFSAAYSHSGGSKEALRALAAGYSTLTDVNEFFNAPAYERLPDKPAPHNLFTTAARFWSYLANQGIATSAHVPSFTFPTTAPVGQSASTISIPYYPAEYSVRYDWRAGEHSYLRAVGGTTQFDAVTAQPLHVVNALVLITDVTPIPRDPLFKVRIRTTGTGTAILFSRGQRFEGTWSKADAVSPLVFSGADGSALPLAPGNTWISVIDASIAPAITVSP